ncbi:uncharacterized protein [Anabrus simplex]|uniref:uncharacterized protein n=1 Tax=Anabrus simplex TaxID=316456 RepID=UPI0035A346AD
MILGDFNAKDGNKEVFVPTIGREGLHDEGNDNAIRLINFTTSTNMNVRSTNLPYKQLHKETWYSCDDKTVNQIDHVLIDNRHRSSITDIRAYRGAEIGSDHNMIIASVKIKLKAFCKSQTEERCKVDTEKLKQEDERLKYNVEITNRFDIVGEDPTEDIEETNEEVCERMWNNAKQIMTTIAILRWDGHVLRMQDNRAPVDLYKRLKGMEEDCEIGTGTSRPSEACGDLSPLEVRLQPQARELLEAVRALLLATHWHSFSVLADNSAATSVLLRKDLAAIFSAPPLNPNTMLLRVDSPSYLIFRKLADISRATRGVVLMMCDINVAKRITSEAKRLNMMSGHFVWLWIDTSASSGITTVDNRTQESNITRSDSAPSSVETRNISRSNTPTPPPWIKTASSGRGNVKPSERRPRKSLDSSVKENSSDVMEDSSSSSSSSSSSINKQSGNFKSSSNELPTRNMRELSDDSVSLADAGISVISSSRIGLAASARGRDSGMSQKYKLSSAKNHEGASILLGPTESAYTHYNVPTLMRDRLADFVHFKDINFETSYVSKSIAKSRGWAFHNDENPGELTEALPVGLLAIKAQPMKLDRHLVKGCVRLLTDTLRRVLTQCADWMPQPSDSEYNASCWRNQTTTQQNFSAVFTRELRTAAADVLAGRRGSEAGEKQDRALLATFQLLNLVPVPHGDSESNASPADTETTLDFVPTGPDLAWRSVGEVTGRVVRLDTIVWPGGDLVVAGLSSRARSVFRVVTALAPPFVMEGELDEDGQCLRGLPCHRVLTSDKDNLTLVFNEMETQERLEEEEEELGVVDTEAFAGRASSQSSEGQLSRRFTLEKFNTQSTFEVPQSTNQQRYKYRTNCCYGLSMDLLENVAQELEFDFHLYIVSDGMFGSKTRHLSRDNESEGAKWNGIVGDLVSGAAHMSFAALSVSSSRAEVIDFSVPYFFSGVSFLAAPTQKSEIPLLAFLLPFSPELWIAIFTSLNITAMAVAVYEWLSPFGLNPWGRQRSKNFSIASALWVMWGLLCGHLVAFKAPKSWPNKFLINVWGGFSVIFVASYTANIAALIAGLFFHNSVNNYHDRGLLSQRVGAPRASAAEYYVRRANQLLWEHMQRYSVRDVEEGIQHLKNGSLDILIADTPILDYYRATDHGCKLQKIGDAINEDTYAVGMSKGFPLKDSISAVIAKYSSNGYMDILQEKWYGALPCFKLATDMAQPRPLGVAAVAGVFILLGVGMALGCLILLVEHLFYRYTLPILRHKPKGTIWRSRNIMFFSQKLYRFINCVELVSPHHAARELVHTLRQGQITSLFQKSVKRKEHEQRRRRKSKAQFFEMIQEIRRVQQEERDMPIVTEVTEPEGEEVPTETEGLNPSPRLGKNLLSPALLRSRSPQPKSSPRPRDRLKSPQPQESRGFIKDIFSPKTKSKSPSGGDRRFSTDMIFNPQKNRLECPSTIIGRRLSKDSSGCWSNSPPDINSRRSSHLDVSSRQDRISSIGRSSNVDLSSSRPPNLSHLNTSPVRECSSHLNISTKPRQYSASFVQENPNVGARLNALCPVSKSAINISSPHEVLARSRSRSPLPSVSTSKFQQSPTNSKLKPSTIPKFRRRIRSETSNKDTVTTRSRPRLRTPSPPEAIPSTSRSRSDLNVIPGRSRSLENHKVMSNTDEIKSISETSYPSKPRRSDFTPYESIIEVNVTCVDSTPEKSVKDKDSDTCEHTVEVECMPHPEKINIPRSPSPYSTFRKAQLKRRQSHQQRLETDYSSGSSSSQQKKELQVPVQWHEKPSKSPIRKRRHQSSPNEGELRRRKEISASSISLSPHQLEHYARRESPQSEFDEVFDDIPPPPPPPSCNPRNSISGGSNGGSGNSPLDRLDKEELVALWRSPESELRSHLLRAIRAKEVTDPP